MTEQPTDGVGEEKVPSYEGADETPKPVTGKYKEPEGSNEQDPEVAETDSADVDS